MMQAPKLLVSAVIRIQEDRVLHLARHCLANGMDPYALLEEVRMGVEKVGELYNQGTLFLADLIMVAEIFKQVQAMIGLEASPAAGGDVEVVFGTVEEDIHDIGKNIAVSVMRSQGINVLDLGVDVPPARFVEQIAATKARILCMSGLITQSYDSMKRTIQLLEMSSLRGKTTVIIGGLVSETIQNYCGSDFWVRDARSGSQLCRGILSRVFQRECTIS